MIISSIEDNFEMESVDSYPYESMHEEFDPRGGDFYDGPIIDPISSAIKGLATSLVRGVTKFARRYKPAPVPRLKKRIAGISDPEVRLINNADVICNTPSLMLDLYTCNVAPVSGGDAPKS